MTERILGPEGSQRRRRFLWVPMLTITALALFFIAGAQAVHNTGLFQLDGDAQKATIPFGPGGAEDWDNVCAKYPPPAGTADNTPGPWCFKNPLVTLPSATSAERSVFITDGFNGTSDNIYKGGTDDGGIIAGDGVGGSLWTWKQAKPSPAKADIEQAFAAQYTCGTTGGCASYPGHKIIYFGGTRLANNGDTNIGLWFLHNKVTTAGSSSVTNADGSVSCPVTSGCGFTGGHTPGNCSIPGHPNPCTPGDLFVQSAFTSKPTITIYEWVGPGKAIAPCVTNVCDLQPVAFTTGADGTNKCEGTGTVNDQGCAIVNDVATVGGTGEITSPWLFQDSGPASPANKIESAELFEGGLDLTGLGFGDECISTVLLNTRSSGSSVNSTAQDFALGNFGGCTSSVVTTPSITSDTQIPASGTISNVTDTAAVDLQGVSNWSASVTFHLCGPADLTAQANCSTGGTAITGGTATNASKNVTSAGATITSVGKYCWRANVHFTVPSTGADDVSDPSNTTSQSECFNITPRTPTLVTQVGGATVTLGNPITDTATLGNTANEPGTPVINPTTAGGPAQGTITIKVFGPDSCTTSAHADFTVSVTAGNGTYGPVSFTPTAVGQYVFVASYSGDSPNTSASTLVACADQPSNEKVTVVGNAHSSSAQDWLPNDTVTLTGDANLTGTLTVTLYNDGTCGQNGGTSKYTKTFTVTNATSGTTFATDNASFKVTASGTYSWLVHYHDNTLTSPADSCSEVTSLTIAN